MDETGWLTASNPDEMRPFVWWNERKRTLYACASVWLLSDVFPDERSLAAIEVAERFQDGLATADQLAEAIRAADAARDAATAAHEAPTGDANDRMGRHGVLIAAHLAFHAARSGHFDGPKLFTARGFWDMSRSGQVAHSRLALRQRCADILRDIAGNPFCPVAFAPSWRTEAAVGIANGIYAERAFDRLPVLADALEEAGCDHPDVLRHCREPGEHARGCWVVDGVLGRT